MGESDDISSEMPEDVADLFLPDLRFDPDCGAIAARSWRPDHRNEQAWIKRCSTANRAAMALRRNAIDDGNPTDESIN